MNSHKVRKLCVRLTSLLILALIACPGREPRSPGSSTEQEAAVYSVLISQLCEWVGPETEIAVIEVVEWDDGIENPGLTDAAISAIRKELTGESIPSELSASLISKSRLGTRLPQNLVVLVTGA